MEYIQGSHLYPFHVDTTCDCGFGSESDPITYNMVTKPHNHKFSAKHEILTDADHLKIYDRTHFKDVW